MKNPLTIGLTAWVSITSLAAVAIKWVLPDRLLEPSTPLFTCIIVLAGTAGLLACLYCFSVFILTRQFNYLLLAMAFSTMGSGSALQAVLDLRCWLPNSQGWLMTISWVFSGVLFTGAAYADSLWKAANRRQTVMQAILAVLLVLAFPIAALSYVQNSILLTSFELYNGTVTWSMVGVILSALTLVLLVIAIFGYLRRVQSRHDRMSSLLCYFLVPYGLGVLCSSATAVRFDQWWVVGQIMLTSAWGVFIIVGSIENAFAHREAIDRLAELEMLHDISWSLVGAGTFTDLLDMLASTLRTRLNAAIAVVFLSDAARQKLSVAAVSSPDDYPTNIGAQYETTSVNRWPGFHSGHTVKALFSAQTQIVRDVFIDVEFVPWQYIATDDGCAVSLPLVHQGTAIGVVDIYFTNWRQLTKQRLKLLSTIAIAATPAIENARARDAHQGISSDTDELDAAA